MSHSLALALALVGWQYTHAYNGRCKLVLNSVNGENKRHNKTNVLSGIKLVSLQYINIVLYFNIYLHIYERSIFFFRYKDVTLFHCLYIFIDILHGYNKNKQNVDISISNQRICITLSNIWELNSDMVENDIFCDVSAEYKYGVSNKAQVSKSTLFVLVICYSYI